MLGDSLSTLTDANLMTDDQANTQVNSGPDQGLEYRYVRDESVRGAGVGAVALVLKTLLRLGSIVLLARLLTPSDFGLVAMAGTVLNLLLIVGDLGLLMASIQRRQLSEDELSTLFWINVGGGVALAALTIASAPLLVIIFDEPRVIGGAAVLSLTLIAVGIGSQHEAIIRRRLNYGFLHTTAVISQAIGLAAALVSAVGGLGYWALILQQVVAQATRTILFWSKTRWRPRRPSRGVDVVPLLRYGSQLVPTHLLAHAARSFGEIIIGAGAGAAQLGLFRRAHGIATLVEEVRQPLKPIVPASLSRLQDLPHEFSRFYVHAVSLSSLAGCGVVGWVTAEAPAVVNLLLGDQWLPTITLIRLLAPSGLALAIGAATEWMLMPLGKIKRLLALRALRLAAIVAGVLVGWHWGVPGIAAGYSVAACASLALELFGATARTTVSVRSLTGAVGRPIIAAACAGYLIFRISTAVSVVTFLLEFVLYVTVFAAIHSALPGGWTVTTGLLRALQKVIGRRRRP